MSKAEKTVRTVRIEVQRSIAVPLDLVRRQFLDIAHHIRQNVHPGLQWSLHSQTNTEAYYRLTQRVLFWPLVDEYRSSLTSRGTVLGEVLSGSNAGMCTEIFFTAQGAKSTHTRVCLTVPRQGAVKWLGPLYATVVRLSLARALAQDAYDLESGRYPSAA
jgi:hypothetical protein